MSGPSTSRAAGPSPTDQVQSQPFPGLAGPTQQFLLQALTNPDFLSQFTQTTPFQQGINRGLTSQFGGPAGADVLSAAQPLFQQNLGDALSRQRAFGGPRFSAFSSQQASELERRSLSDFNLFSQQVMESGRSRQLQALLGAGQLQLGGRGQDLGFLQNILGTAFTAGGATTAPTLQQSQGTFGDIMDIGGMIAALIASSQGVGSPPGTSA